MVCSESVGIILHVSWEMLTAQNKQFFWGHYARRAVAKRSYPTSEVRGSGREYQTATAQEQPRGATAHPRSGRVAQRRYPASEARGGDKRSYPASKVRGCD